MISVNDYTVISISDDRLDRKKAIHERVGLNEVTDIEFVEGLTADIEALKSKFGIKDIWKTAKYGEVGVWFSFLNICEYVVNSGRALLAIEDDAFLHPNFNALFEIALDQIPDTADAFSVAVPHNQRNTAYIEWLNKDTGLAITHTGIAPTYDIGQKIVCRAYQGYSFVGMVYTPKGASKILSLVRETGMNTPADCWLFEANDANKLEVYTFVPDMVEVISVDWDKQYLITTVHNTEVMV